MTLGYMTTSQRVKQVCYSFVIDALFNNDIKDTNLIVFTFFIFSNKVDISAKNTNKSYGHKFQ